MANKQINELNAAPSIDPSSDLVIIQKASGGTYRITVDELVNASSKVSSSTQLGAPEIISEKVSGAITKTITRTNLFATNSSGAITIKSRFIDGWNRTTGNPMDINIAKMPGLNSVVINGGTILSVGAPAEGFTVVSYRYTSFKTQQTAKGYIRLSVTKDSLIIDTTLMKHLGSLRFESSTVTGQMSISS